MKITVVIPFCKDDLQLTLNLLGWIKELGGLKQNHCVLVCGHHAENGIWPTAVDGIQFEASDIFKSVTLIRTPFPLKDESHPRGANWMFETTLKHMAATKASGPWLWLEPDAVPMRSGWIQEIEEEYVRGMNQGYPILACVAELNDPEYSARIPSGVAVYPSNALGFYKELSLNRDKAWDVAFADRVASKVFHTTKIWNVLNHKTPPVFVEKYREFMSNRVLKFETVRHCALVHPSKDGSLLKILRSQPKPVDHVRSGIPYFPRPENPKLAVVAYLPPEKVTGAKAFLENVTKFDTKNELILYADTPAHPEAFQIDDPETCKGQANKLAVNNCVFLFGLKIAINRKIDFMLYLEADCRVNGSGWDGILFDEFLANPDALLGGSPVIRNVNEASEIEKLKSNQMSIKFTQDTKIPMIFQMGDNMGFMLHPNGAIGIYSTALLAKIFPGYEDPIKNAYTYTAWDLEIGAHLAKQGYDPFAIFATLTKSYSGWKNQVLSSKERKQLMAKRGFVAIHQVKDEWAPP